MYVTVNNKFGWGALLQHDNKKLPCTLIAIATTYGLEAYVGGRCRTVLLGLEVMLGAAGKVSLPNGSHRRENHFIYQEVKSTQGAWNCPVGHLARESQTFAMKLISLSTMNNTKKA